MTPNEKLKVINEKVELLNDGVLKNKKWKLTYVNKGANNYCLTITLKNKELFSGKFNTYDSVLSALQLLEYMFSKALDELNKKD